MTMQDRVLNRILVALSDVRDMYMVTILGGSTKHSHILRGQEMEIVNTIGVATNIQLAQSSVELRRMLYKTWKQLIHKQYAMRNKE